MVSVIYLCFGVAMGLPKKIMKIKQRKLDPIGSGTLALALLMSPLALAQSGDGEDEVFELSPFVVDGSEDQGYRATSTLAGTRIKTELKDLGTAVSVVTKEFMEDVGATDSTELLSYTLNTETGGNQGNFSGATNADDGRYFNPEARTDPQFNQRVRGIGRAALTRGYFLTDIPFDSYNTDRVAVNRGPNSLLFGIGDPGGVINNSVKQANFVDSNELSFRVGSYDSYRTEIDLNRVLIEDRLAVRIAGVYDDRNFRQDPTWEKDNRIYAAMEAVLFKNEGSEVLGPTRLRLNGEAGSIEASPSEDIGPSLAYTNWFEPVDPSIEQYTGAAPSSTHVAPEDGGSWVFQETYNPFVYNSEGQVNTNVQPNIFRHVAVVYSQPDATRSSLGLSGPDPLDPDRDLSEIGGYSGLLLWNNPQNTFGSGGVAGTPGAIDAGADEDTRLRNWMDFHTNSPYAESYATGFAVPTLQNREVFDYRNHIYSGGIDRLWRSFEAKNAAIEQTFFDNQLGFEIAFDEQTYRTTQDFYFSGGGSTGGTGPYDVYIDIKEYLSNGMPNPNLGRAYTRVAEPNIKTKVIDRSAKRATVFGTYDFATKHDGWMANLGRHQFTGLVSTFTEDNFRQQEGDSWNSTQENVSSIQDSTDLGFSRRWTSMMVYTSEDNRGLQSMDDIRLSQINVPRPVPNTDHRILFIDRNEEEAEGRAIDSGVWFIQRYLKSQSVSQQTVDAKALSWQGYFFDRNVVALAGWREDDTVSYSMADNEELGRRHEFSNGTWDPTTTVLSGTPTLEEKGETFTYSLVARVPDNPLFNMPDGTALQFHYGKSENFNPIGFRNDSLGRPIGQPTGTTEEYGFQVDLMDNKFSLRANWFQTKLNDVNASGAANVPSFVASTISNYINAQNEGVPFVDTLELVDDPSSHPIQSYEQFYDAMINAIPSELRSVINPTLEDEDADGIFDDYDYDNIQNMRATANRAAKGFEIEATANPTENWRVSLNIGRQETVQTDTAVVNSALAEAFDANLRSAGLFDVRSDARGVQVLRSLETPWNSLQLSNVRAARAFDGTASNEQREWRANLVTRYGFKDGRMKGFHLGGALRWQSEAATGYVFYVDPVSGLSVPDPSRPFMDDGLTSGDVFFGYKKKIFDDRVDWKVQLNIRNAISEDEDIPVKTNPDGTVAVVRVPNPTEWFLTNTFSF